MGLNNGIDNLRDSHLLEGLKQERNIINPFGMNRKNFRLNVVLEIIYPAFCAKVARGFDEMEVMVRWP